MVCRETLQRATPLCSEKHSACASTAADAGPAAWTCGGEGRDEPLAVLNSNGEYEAMANALGNAVRMNEAPSPRERRRPQKGVRQGHHSSPSRPCARCGETRQAGGYRSWRYGVAYCDGCAKLLPSWNLGMGWAKFSPMVVEAFKPTGVDLPAVNHV